MNNNYRMIAVTLYGLEEILAKELRLLGAQKINILNRAVEFYGDLGFMYKANLNLRTAIRILKPIFSFRAINENELYIKINSFNWQQYINVTDTFAIYTSGYSETFSHTHYTSLKAKDAIVDLFRDKYNKRPSVKIENPDIQINIYVNKHNFSVSLDSSGESLHKRGYKVSTVEAPISEVLAAGLILLSGWNKIDDFYDPMCGSGTILIEAAMIAYNIPANIFRKRFGFEGWKNFDNDLWDKIKDISLQKERSYEGNISGSDYMQKSLRSCRKNINSVLMRNEISVDMIDFFDSCKNMSHVIFNPPYGERMDFTVEEFYKKIGDTLKNNYQGSIVWIISSDIENVKMIGLKPSKKIKIYNGPLECVFLGFDIYKGSRKSRYND